MSNVNRFYFFSPFYINTGRDNLSTFSFINKCFWMLLGLTGTVIGLVLLYLGMRGVMDLGGFVATGGPYHIIHRAPDWFWVFPVSIFGGLFCILIYFLNARRIGGIKLLLFLWSALFLSLGYNFMEYAIWKGDHSKIVFGWLIPGILFVLMGGIPLIVIVASIFKYFKNKNNTEQKTFANYYSTSGDQENHLSFDDKLAGFIVVLINISGIGGGIYLGIYLFKIITG